MNPEIDMSYGSDYHYLPVTSFESGTGHEVATDLFSHTVQIVNVIFAGTPENGEWVLVDAGMPNSAHAIITAAEKRFGTNRNPKAIVLTHGHFDHVGAIVDLVQHWKVQVYAHEHEMPYLQGQLSYSAPDPSIQGVVAKLSFMFPIEPIHLGNHVSVLPSDGTVPHMTGWRWIHTPGHTPGHVSLFREEDRALIAGDAFVTVKQESLYKVITQELEISGPPKYFTPDWPSARESVRKLEALHPRVAITGHGMPMEGETLRSNLERLARDFDRMAIPDEGKYVNH